MQKNGEHQGFTLIELLIVVAIIAILAAIAVPNFLEAQIRAKVSRAQTDLRSVGIAIEAYRVDWNCVPPWQSWEEQGVVTLRRNMLPGHFWWALSTPVAYLTSALPDPFVAIGRHSQSAHAGDGDLLDAFLQMSTGAIGPSSKAGRTEWLGMSYGPDGADDTDLNGAYPYTQWALPYDPTNGTASWGDIYRHGGRMPVNFIAGSSAVPNHGSNCTNNTNGAADPYSWSH